jgi:hypothetical protein
MSLIPEKPIVISPTLAATIGLEETVLLQLMQECLAHGNKVQSSGFNWVTVPGQRLMDLAPFWREDDIRRLSASLHEKGLLLIGGGAFSAQQDFRFAFNEGGSSAQAPSNTTPRTGSQINEFRSPHSAKTIGGSWQPSEDALRQLGSAGCDSRVCPAADSPVCRLLARAQCAAAQLGIKIYQRGLASVAAGESTNHRRRREVSVTGEWRPSKDAYGYSG